MAAIDNPNRFRTEVERYAYNSAAAVTPDDNNDLAYMTRAVYVGGTGDLTVIMAAGQTVTFKAVPTGTLLEIRCSRVKATNTTATQLVALW